MDHEEGSKLEDTFSNVVFSFPFYIYLVVLGGLMIIDSLISTLFYVKKESKYKPDFEVKYNAKTKISDLDKDNYNMALSGISDIT